MQREYIQIDSTSVSVRPSNSTQRISESNASLPLSYLIKILAKGPNKNMFLYTVNHPYKLDEEVVKPKALNYSW